MRPRFLVLAVLPLLAGCATGGDVELVPPARVSPGTTSGWHQVEAQGVALRVPGEWVQQDLSGCEFEYVRFGPADADPCVDGPGVGLFASATFDPAMGPGELVERGGMVAGWVTGNDETDVDAVADTRGVLEQVLASVQPTPKHAYATGRWKDRGGQGLAWRYPASWDAIDSSCASSWAVGGVRAPDVEPRATGGCWTGQVNVARTSSLLRVRAPSQAVAQLVLGSGRPAR